MSKERSVDKYCNQSLFYLKDIQKIIPYESVFRISFVKDTNEAIIEEGIPKKSRWVLCKYHQIQGKGFI